MDGIHALLAEWRALTDPRTEHAAAQIKIDWWRHEMDRLGMGAPTHPISRYLLALPRAEAAAFRPLARSIDACAAEVAGVPLEHGEELDAHADALHGVPLLIATRLGGVASPEVADCTRALGTGVYLAAAVSGYRRAATVGRLPFAVDELLAAGVEDADLAAAVPPPALRAYLEGSTRRAREAFDRAQRTLRPETRAECRHLAVLAALERDRLDRPRTAAETDFRWRDLYNAWNAARRAAAGR